MTQPLQIQLSWEDPATGERREPRLNVPIAFGREFARMPTELDGQRVARMLLNSNQVSRFHAAIAWEGSELVVTDQGSVNGIFINGQLHKRSVLTNGDTLQIGPYTMTVILVVNTTPPASTNPSTIAFNPTTNLPDPRPQLLSPPMGTVSSSFPPPAFSAQQVSIQALHATGLPVDERDYVAIGGGLGSFVWVNLLRIGGVSSRQIVALGLEKEPYARYKRLCLSSQIPLHERLRSNSDSCPDNIWGWPSYALREAWHDLGRGKINTASQYLWQVFSEPTFAETYTPRAMNVFESIDREAKRIGWDEIYRYGRVRSIRKTDDGRYAIAYSRQGPGNYALLITRYIHLATGYPAIQFLPDLQAYRQQYQDFKSVVNAYEPHDHVYEQLEKQGGTVLIRGRGIVASRIIQRIYEARKHNKQIQVLHLMRSPKPQGNKFQKATRIVKNHSEFQPFNWPKACWGGELRVMLEKASPDERKRLLSDWGGTTTADRRDWQKITATGLSEGWYQIAFGEVQKVERDAQRTITLIQEKSFGEMKLAADFIVDATGLDAKVDASPLLDDLVKHYNLPLNHLGRFVVDNNFELIEMRSGKGQMYAAGAITLGGPYAAVDSFLGLQYSALVAVDSLAATRSVGLHRLNIFTSLQQWVKWVFNQSPG
jgi:pSer/pThr/pTyr-binding forkhead associated (FHA) protein